MKRKKVVTRTCLGCKHSGDKRDFIRVVRTPEGQVMLDLSGKKNGRGAYFCPNENCLRGGIKRLDYALRVKLTPKEKEDLIKEFLEIISVR